MSKQPPPAPTASTVGPCPTLIQISRTPRHWKFTQHHRTTRPPPEVKELGYPKKKKTHQNGGDVGVGGVGWDGATVLGKLSVPVRPTDLENSRASACCACRACGWRLFGHFFLFIFSLLFLWKTARSKGH